MRYFTNKIDICPNCFFVLQVDRKPEREFRGTTTTIVLKLCMPLGNSRLQNAKKYLVVRSKWHLTRVMNLSTQLREFQALSAIGNLPLSRLVLCPSTSEKTNLLKNGTAGLKDLTAELGDRIKADYNESQVSAIAAAVGRQDIAAADHQLALVQGPPGKLDFFLDSPVSENCVCRPLDCFVCIGLSDQFSYRIQPGAIVLRVQSFLLNISNVT